MNTKTTFALALVLALLVLGLVTIRKSAPVAPPPTTQAMNPSSAVTRNLITDPLGNIVKVVAKRGGGDEWVFEKKDAEEGAGAPVWQMTKPKQCKALAYEVDRIGRELGRLQYEVAYKEGEPGAVTAAGAGLAPPEATVTLTDDAGKTASIELGAPASETETYVRLAGANQIVIAKSNLRNLLKTKPLDYREQQVWNFAAENATHVEIVDRSASPGDSTTFAFTRTGGQWMMNAPASAPATGKVDELLRLIGRLRVGQWESDDAASFAMFGLEPPALSVKVTIEETVPAKQEEKAEKDDDEETDDGPEPPVEKRTTTHELFVSARSPIGDDTKVYVGVAGEQAVGTVLKGTTDKFKPVMTEWRDMRLTTADIASATRIERTESGQTEALVRHDGTWVFENGGAAAEQHAVTELLAAMTGLKAVAFVEGPDAPTNTGLEAPQTVIRLSIPGVDQPELLAVGASTDATSRRMVFVRRNDDPIAKVKSDDVVMLLRPAAAYRDRTVFALTPERVTRIDLAIPNKYTAGREALTLERGEDVWTMTAPVASPLRDDLVNKLVASLCSLRAESVIAGSGQASAFGLHDPAITVKLTLNPPAVSGDRENSESKDQPREVELAVSEHDGKTYAKRGNDDTIYELKMGLRDELLAEFRAPDVFDFDPADVTALRIKHGDETTTFVRADGKWKFDPEPDLPIDSARIDKLLADAKALQADRFAAHSSNDLSRFGLAEPGDELSITLKNEQHQSLVVSKKLVDGEVPSKHFAMIANRPGVFLIASDAVAKLIVPLNQLEKK